MNEDEFYKYIGERIQLWRKNRDMTLKALGRLVGYSPSAINRFEIGNRRPSIWELRRIADALQVPVLAFYPPERILTDDTQENP